MSYKYEVHEKFGQRISLVSFHRAAKGAPKLDHPDIDDRGYFGTTGQGISRGPVVGVTESDTVFIEMKRERISENADLFVASSDPQVMTVTNIAGTDNLPFSPTTRLKITGVKGSDGVAPKTAEILIKYGDKKVVIGAMSVWVFTKLEVSLTAHSVTIRDAAGSSLSPSIDINAAIEVAKAVWQPCGISLTFLGQPQFTSKTFRKPGEVWKPYLQENLKEEDLEEFRKSEVIDLFSGRHHSPKSINVYFVNIIRTQKGLTTAGFTLNPTDAFRASGKPVKEGIEFPNDKDFKPSVRPGIVIATEGDDTDSIGHTLAHEIGHFIGLDHIDGKEAKDAREDIWSKRMLMFPTIDFKIGISAVSDVGYGNKLTGALITLKDLMDVNNLRNHSTDAEWHRARATIKRAVGLYEFTSLDEFTK